MEPGGFRGVRLPDSEGPCNLTGENEEEEEEAVEYETTQWISRNGEILWFAILTPGPTHYTLARIRTPECAFGLFFFFFPDEILH